MNDKNDIEIRPVSSFPDLRQIEDLQRAIWVGCPFR